MPTSLVRPRPRGLHHNPTSAPDPRGVHRKSWVTVGRLGVTWKPPRKRSRTYYLHRNDLQLRSASLWDSATAIS